MKVADLLSVCTFDVLTAGCRRAWQNLFDGRWWRASFVASTSILEHVLSPALAILLLTILITPNLDNQVCLFVSVMFAIGFLFCLHVVMVGQSAQEIRRKYADKLLPGCFWFICGVDAAVGGAIGYLAGNAMTGALAGGMVGVLNYRVLSARLLQLGRRQVYSIVADR